MTKQSAKQVLSRSRAAIGEAEALQQQAQRKASRQRRLLSERQQAVSRTTKDVQESNEAVETARKRAYIELFIAYFENEEVLTGFYRTIYDCQYATVAAVAEATGFPEEAAELLLDGFCTAVDSPLDKSVMYSWKDGQKTYSLTYAGLDFLMRRDDQLFEKAARDWARNGGSEYGSHGRPTDNLAAGRILQDLAAVKRAKELGLK
jgi:hypothetical protein